MSEYFISIVIPAFNEAARIESTIESIFGYISSRFDEFEIIVVDDGSTDDTAFVVSSFIKTLRNVHLIKTATSNTGKGFATKTGILASNGSLLLYCDADMSTPIEEIEKLLP